MGLSWSLRAARGSLGLAGVVIDLELALQVAVEAADVGAAVARRSFGRDIERRLKGDGTWVTEADRAAEEAVRSLLSSAFPDHNILGEEDGELASSGGPPVAGAPTWIVDPIDGTNNYIAGIPIWATLVALRLDDRSVVGACNAPALGEAYDGAEGFGARLNGSAIAADRSVSSLDRATVLFADAASFYDGGRVDLFEALVLKSERTRGLGDFWGHMLVARGAAHVMLEPRLSVWDVAALEPIVGEAAGRLTGWDGGPWDDEQASCLTTNELLHDELLSLLRSRRGEPQPNRGGG